MKNSRTTFILACILAILAILGYFLVKNNNTSSSSIDIRDRQFAIKEREDISKILLAQRNGRKMILEKKGDIWVANGKHEVHSNVMGNLLDVLTGLQLKYIPPKAAYDNMMKAIGRLGIKVEVYNEKGVLLKGYQVGGTTGGELGTVFLMDGYTQPYVLELPNFEGSLRGRFLVDNVDHIRDRTVFSYDREEIKQISVRYPKEEKQSFMVVRESNDKFEVKPYNKDGYSISGEAKAGAIQAFVRAFQDVDAEAYENNHPLKDSIQSLVPIAVVSVTDIQDQTKSVRLFPQIDVYNPDINTRGVDQDRRIERYFADCSWGEFMIVQDLLFRKILWRYEEFY
ncbi:hypothetical protein [Portibacter marinus]|uniref:hypothetical protein n=1 Tax=Portibacter marinus TaxID=2898660 RepID=UPI001F2D3AD7|nr:hypothetical protein [Portibacter marinus]